MWSTDLIHENYQLPSLRSTRITCRCEYCVLRVSDRETLPYIPLEAYAPALLVHACTRASVIRRERVGKSAPTRTYLSVYISHDIHYGFIYPFKRHAQPLYTTDVRILDVYSREETSRKIISPEVILNCANDNFAFYYDDSIARLLWSRIAQLLSTRLWSLC